jgi:hypothetical protein
MNRPTKSSIALLALAGCGSAALTLFTTSVPRLEFQIFYVGFIFGVTLCVYFLAYEGYRNPAKIGGFICACIAAYPAAVFAGFGLQTVFPVNGSMGSAGLDIPMPVFFAAGALGALIVITAGVMLFGDHNIGRNAVRMVLLGTVGGGILGVIGGGADGLRTRGTYHDLVLLFLIWQPGVAALLGQVLRYQRGTLPKPLLPAKSEGKALTYAAKNGIPMVSLLFFAVVLGFLGFLIHRELLSKRLRDKIETGRKRSFSDAPVMSALADVRPLPPEEALIVREIGGLHPWLPMSSSSHELSRTLPPAINYVVGYVPTKEPPNGASIQRIVAVGVTQLPNAEWARYRVRYPLSNEAITNPASLTDVVKFGQTVVQDTAMRYPNGGGSLCFLWPSSNLAISICYETPEVNEEFIRQYLEKYPSSL